MFRLNKYVHIIKNENYIALFNFMNGKIILFVEAEAIDLINTVMETRMKRYLYRSNNIPMAVLGWKSPNQKQREMETA